MEATLTSSSLGNNRVRKLSHTEKKKKERVVSQTLHMNVQTETLFLFVYFVSQCYIYSCLAKLQPFLLFFSFLLKLNKHTLDIS